MSEFEEDLQAANDLYEKGEYSKAIQACFFALEHAENDEKIAVVLDRRGWSARYVGFKSEDEGNREAAYKMAKEDWRKVLEISSDIDLKISAIKGLMLLPGEGGEKLFRMGIAIVDKHAENPKAELRNSYGLLIREKNPVGAADLFRNAYKTVEKGTTIAGHLMQNLGTCLLIMKNDEEDPKWKMTYAIKAIRYLETAMEEYPESQIEHRRSTQEKIDNTKKEIEALTIELEK